jgi:hypothetical protein
MYLQIYYKTLNKLTNYGEYRLSDDWENGYDSIIWLDVNKELPSKEVFDAEVEIVLKSTCLELIREKRNELLKDSDWRINDDYPYADKELWKEYRTNLREFPNKIENGDLPTPSLDENGNLINVNWPEKPE